MRNDTCLFNVVDSVGVNCTYFINPTFFKVINSKSCHADRPGGQDLYLKGLSVIMKVFIERDGILEMGAPCKVKFTPSN